MMTINPDQYPTHVYDDGQGNVSYVPWFDGADPEIVKPLPPGFWVVEARERIWSLVKVQRDELVAGGCDTPSGRVDTDAKSLAAIDRKLAAAQLNPETWSDVFTMEDNEEEPIGVAEIIAIKNAVEAHEQAVRNAARDVRDDLFDDDITTLAALFAVAADLTERMA